MMTSGALAIRASRLKSSRRKPPYSGRSQYFSSIYALAAWGGAEDQPTRVSGATE